MQRNPLPERFNPQIDGKSPRQRPAAPTRLSGVVVRRRRRSSGSAASATPFNDPMQVHGSDRPNPADAEYPLLAGNVSTRSRQVAASRCANAAGQGHPRQRQHAWLNVPPRCAPVTDARRQYDRRGTTSHAAQVDAAPIRPLRQDAGLGIGSKGRIGRGQRLCVRCARDSGESNRQQDSAGHGVPLHLGRCPCATRWPAIVRPADFVRWMRPILADRALRPNPAECRLTVAGLPLRGADRVTGLRLVPPQGVWLLPVTSVGRVNPARA